MNPTDDDLSRCAAADLAVCEAATPGEWMHDGDGAIYCDHFEPTLADVCWRGHPSEVPQVGKDAEFIALARTALPAWIRRAQDAEAENVRLRNVIAGHEKAAALMNAGMESQCSLMDAMKQELRSAQTEVARLRDVCKVGEKYDNLSDVIRQEAEGLLAENAALKAEIDWLRDELQAEKEYPREGGDL
jgi:hypothetical protein